MAKPTADAIAAGQAVYTERTLKIYDLFVVGLSNRLIRRCPTAHQLAHYDSQVSGNHLDVGVGSGFYPDRARFPVRRPRLALMDLNDSVLEYAARRITRYRPEIHPHNVFDPITRPLDPFDSVAVNYLFHCLPGTMADKALVLDNLRAVMSPGARLFGATILQGDVSRNTAARALMAVYNRKGILSNTTDDTAGLNRALMERFDDVRIDVHGCVALFSARNP